MLRRSDPKALPSPTSCPLADGHLPAAESRDTLPLLVRSAFTPPLSELSQHLSNTEQHFMRTFYGPTVPDLSDGRRTQFQHRANATSQLFEALRSRGYTRDDVRFALEKSRYAPFLSEVQAWIRSGGETAVGNAPQPIVFDIRHRAYAKDAFQHLARELRIPHYLWDNGTIEPIFHPKSGFAMRIHADGQRWTFLTALANGTLLAPPSGDAQELARGLSSPNRQLVNILELQSPVHLEKAVAKRPVSEVGSKRVSLFLRNDESSPTNYVYLPPSLADSHLVPRVDWEGLMAGRKRLFLISADSKKIVATVDIPPGAAPVSKVSLAREVAASPFKRFKPLGAFLRGRSAEIPKPVEIEIHRSPKTAAYTQQRILLGKQMSVPAWYPLRTMTVQPGIAPDGTRFLGLYPPGVSPATNPPLRAFTLETSRVHLKPISVDTVWPGLAERAEELRTLVKDVASKNGGRSREAWLAIHELGRREPLLISTLLLAKESPFSICDESALAEIPGWEIFKSELECSLLREQARSVPHVARLLARAHGPQTAERSRALSRLDDISFAKPKDALSHLTRLATVTPDALEESLNHLRNSHDPAVLDLVGAGSLHKILQHLVHLEKLRAKE